MLGPADEFGIRQTYSANSVTVHADGQFAAAPALPQITSYRRAERDYSNPHWESVAFGAEDPSFVLAEDNEFFSVNFSPKSLNTDLNGYRYTHAGSELVFASLLEPSLPDEVLSRCRIAYQTAQSGRIPTMTIASCQMSTSQSSITLPFLLANSPTGTGSSRCLLALLYPNQQALRWLPFP